MTYVNPITTNAHYATAAPRVEAPAAFSRPKQLLERVTMIKTSDDATTALRIQGQRVEDFGPLGLPAESTTDKEAALLEGDPLSQHHLEELHSAIIIRR